MVLPLLFALTVACASAARFPSIHPSLPLLSKDFPSYAEVRGAAQARDGKEDWTAMPGRMAMKFIVPPSKAQDFKEAWLKLQAAVEEKEGEQAKVFAVQKSGLDNWVWWQYGEWETLDAMYNKHFETEWYADFSSAVDDMGASWEAFWLGEVGSYTGEGEKEHDKDEGSSKSEFSVVATWLVPSGYKKEFVEAWSKEAESIVKEAEGVKKISLYKDWMQGSKFYVYGEWESFDAFLEHLKSDRRNVLMEWAADNDAYVMVEPLMRISEKKD